MKTIIRILFCLLMFLPLLACDLEPKYEYIYLKNDCDERIYVFDYGYEDNTPIIPADVIYRQDPKIIEAGVEGLATVFSTEWFEKGCAAQFIVYKESTWKKYTMEEIKRNDIFDKRFFLRLPQLKACKNHVKYSEGKDRAVTEMS